MVSEPVAYLVLGSYVHPHCARSLKDEDRRPVLADELPGVVRCPRCDELVLAEPCVFCEIVAGDRPAEWVVRPDFWPDAVAFTPLEPVVEGHCLIVPKRHVRDFSANPAVFATTARRAGELMRWSDKPVNLLTNMGAEAGQSVMHLHIHLIPREAGDGIRLLTRRKEKK